ncbi:MAG: hypothetical protein KC897_02700 [Candidatus Omnitrophica bacterium]|nr:hypothetical protein [Candidatus Omnitrophota bacterium]MCB9722243.1 hypothetical protein [Candidatus Omnitrophota bacterium]
MTYPDSLRGIALIIVSSFITIYGLVGGISQISGQIYRDDLVYPVSLHNPGKELQTALLSVDRNETRSFWLRVPDRRIENRDMQFQLRLIDGAGNAVADWSEDFRSGYLRNSTGRRHYYRIGQHDFTAGFTGYFRYATGGSWRPTYNGVLVLRDKGQGAVPYKFLGVIGVGVMILIIGLRQLPTSIK